MSESDVNHVIQNTTENSTGKIWRKSKLLTVEQSKQGMAVSITASEK